MGTTGYSDTFNRTVANGFGTSSDGHVYTPNATASWYSVAPSTAQIAQAATGTPMALVDLQTQNVDISGRVALSAIPITNLATVGFAVKASSGLNNYLGTMMVATGGVMSIRFSRIVAGGLITISTTTLTGLTYVANTFYNLRFQAYWSRVLQTNVLQAKVWLVGTTEPGGWQASAQDAAFTDYTAGTQVGPYSRDESTVQGAVIAKWQAVAVRSYSLPVPATTDTMCADPAFVYPKQTALQSLAAAADTAMTALDPLTSLAGLFPRVRVSNSNVPVNTALFPPNVFNTTEFNIGTATNLGYDNTAVYLPVGLWLLSFEVYLAEAVAAQSDAFVGVAATPISSQLSVSFRTNTAQVNDQGTGGTGHMQALTFNSDPVVPMRAAPILSWHNLATTYTIKYMAFTAIKISDYFV